MTGCPRSGTGYTSKLFTELGLPCGHEDIFNIDGLSKTNQIVWPRWFVGESSWLAAPFLGMLPRDLVVFHQVREPVAFTRSLLRSRFFQQPDKYTAFAFARFPELLNASLSHVERCLLMWLRWNEMIEDDLTREERIHCRYQVEYLDMDKLADLTRAIGHEADSWASARSFAAVPTNYNTRGNKEGDESIRWSGVPASELKSEVESLARRYGYRGESSGGRLRPVKVGDS